MFSLSKRSFNALINSFLTINLFKGSSTMRIAIIMI
jgi:hypothetical protein